MIQLIRQNPVVAFSENILKTGYTITQNPRFQSFCKITGGVIVVAAVCTASYKFFSNAAVSIEPASENVHRPAVHPLILHPSPPEEHLLKAVQNNNPEECRAAIALGANPNIRDAEGQTLVQLARKCNALETCKALIDNGANLTAEDVNAIKVELIGRGIKNSAVFFAKCPNPYESEVFLDGRFQPLSSLGHHHLQHANSFIVTLIADEPLEEGYGNVMTSYASQAYVDSMVKFPTKLLMVQVRVDNIEKLAPTIAKIAGVVSLPCTGLILKAHGNINAVQFSKDSVLTEKNCDALQNIDHLMIPQATVILDACQTAGGNDNIAKVISRCLPLQIVFAPKTNVFSTGYHLTASASQPELFRLFPAFYTRPTRYTFAIETKAYKNGVEVMNEKFDSNDDLNNPEHPIQAQIQQLWNP